MSTLCEVARRRTSPPWSGPCRIRLSWLLAGLVAVVAACGSGGDELTLDQQLTKLAGERLSEAQVADRLELADLLCRMERPVLERIWNQLDARELEFQDFVFGQHCPDRLSVYEPIRSVVGTVPEDVLATTTTAAPMFEVGEAETLTELLEAIVPAKPVAPEPGATTTTTATASTTTTTRP